MYSLRRRLTLSLALGFSALTVAAGLWMTHALEGRATDEFDDALRVKARALASLTEQERGHIEFDYTPERMPEFERDDGPEYFQFWLDDGKVLLRSRRLATDLPRLRSIAEASSVADAPLPDGRAGRVARIAFTPKASGAAADPGDGPDPASERPTGPRRALFLSVARSRAGLDAAIGGTRATVLGVGGVAALLAVFLAWGALRAGLRPVEAIAAQVRDVDAERLSTRVALPRIPREIAPVVTQLNALLDRLSAAIERERRFAANVAHELRTPIAELRSLAAVGAKWPDDPDATARFFDDVDEIAGRMDALVADLLLLARCHAGVESVARERTSLCEVVERAWAPHAPRAAERSLRLVLDVPGEVVVESDAGKLGILFGNLLANAVAYALEGTDVRCVGSTEGLRFCITVENDAPPLGAGALARLAEPFWRGDDSRESSEHTGLGLSLVAAIAALLGLEVHFDQAAGGTFRASVTGPAAGASRPAGRGAAGGAREPTEVPGVEPSHRLAGGSS